MLGDPNPNLGMFCAVLVDLGKDLAADHRLCRAWHARGEAMLGIETPHHLACDDLRRAAREDSRLRRRCQLRNR